MRLVSCVSERNSVLGGLLLAIFRFSDDFGFSRCSLSYSADTSIPFYRYFEAHGLIDQFVKPEFADLPRGTPLLYFSLH